jgi:hypothetical protein
MNLAAQLTDSGITVNAMRLESTNLDPRDADTGQSGASIYQRLVQRRPKTNIVEPEYPTMGLLDLILGDLNGEIVNSDVLAALKTSY